MWLDYSCFLDFFPGLRPSNDRQKFAFGLRRGKRF